MTSVDSMQMHEFTSFKDTLSTHASIFRSGRRQLDHKNDEQIMPKIDIRMILFHTLFKSINLFNSIIKLVHRHRRADS